MESSELISLFGSTCKHGFYPPYQIVIILTDFCFVLFSFYYSAHPLGEGDMSEGKNDWLPSRLNPLQYLR